MKKIGLYILLLILSVSNLFSQKSDTGYIQVDGDKLFYEAAGKGETIVLIHDGLIHHEIWDEQFPVFAKTHRVVRYDRRGYGKSSQPKAPFSNIEDLNQLFIQLNIDNAIVFGMSAGGALAIDFTLKYPEKVTGLVLVGAVVSGYGYSSHMLSRGGRINLAEMIADPDKLIKYFGWEDPYEIHTENIKAKEKCLKLLEAYPNNVSFERNRYVQPPDRPAVKFLSEIKVPALVLIGEFDIPDVHAHSGVIESGIANAKREIIFKCGHLIPLEQPEAFNITVSKFLDSIEFKSVLNSRGVDAAVQYFHQKRETEPGIILFEEIEMNALGYSYLQNGNIKDAINLFKINTIAYPKSWNVYDSLGEAYLKDGQKELAIKNYEKALELNPDNANAKQVLKELRQEK